MDKNFNQCDCCGFETYNPSIKFHKVNKRSHINYETICDLCYSNTNSVRLKPELDYLAFAQVINWLNEQMQKQEE